MSNHENAIKSAVGYFHLSLCAFQNSLFDLNSNPFKKHPEIVTGLPVESNSINNIVINGCGGTGGWFIPKLAKILLDASMKNKLAPELYIYFIDGDTVAEKNIIRQNFIHADVGKNKASVLAARYAGLFPNNVSLSYVDKYATADAIYDSYDPIIQSKFIKLSSLPPFGRGYGSSATSGETLVINFVDNAISRRSIHAACISSTSAFVVIDAGNNLYNGQVNISKYKSGYTDSIDAVASNYYLRNYNELEDYENVKLENCADADLAINNPEQLFNANDMAAAITANVVNNIFANSSISHGLVKFITGKSLSIQNSYPLLSINFFDNTVSSSHAYHCYNTIISHYICYGIDRRFDGDVDRSVKYFIETNRHPVTRQSTAIYAEAIESVGCDINPNITYLQRMLFTSICDFSQYLKVVSDEKAGIKENEIQKAA